MRLSTPTSAAPHFPSLAHVQALQRAAAVGVLALGLSACSGPFRPTFGPDAPVPGTEGSAPAAANMTCARAGEIFFRRPWQSTAFGGSRQRPDGNYEVILNNADGRRALCTVTGEGAVLALAAF